MKRIKHISIILMEPKHPGNVGAIARIMKNFGFTDLVLINPAKDCINEDTCCRAKHAQDILKNVQVKDIDFLEEMDCLIGTTAKLGGEENLPRIPLTPKQMTKKIHPDIKTGILIGREGPGLYNSEVEMCDMMVSIPANTDYSTLNISHAVGILLYEIYNLLSSDSFNHEASTNITGIIKSATREEKNNIMTQLENVLEKVDFITTTKKETQIKAWKKIFGKSMLTKKEASAVFGFLNKINKKI